jgi:DNA invertase Pin-like site-specific DNA recombinase
MKDAQIKCAIYVRVSTDDGRQDTQNQLLMLHKYAEQQNWPVVRVYQDHASAKSDDREAFQRMLDDGGKHRFNTLLFWSLDRLSRQGVLPTLYLLQRFTKLGINYCSYSEQYLDSCGMFRDAVISILATIAKQERLRISERTKAGLERQKTTGKPGPKGFYGPGHPLVEFDVDLAVKLRNDNLSYAQIAEQLAVSKTTIYRFFQTPKSVEHSQAG